ncbi:MAG: peptidyl-prolyl cis-trans isomerase [Kiritimatiellae bacterium]|nr:peptidyl-prolyl cis-trans isomerase [Kiritimatiellia bacterium]
MGIRVNGYLIKEEEITQTMRERRESNAEKLSRFFHALPESDAALREEVETDLIRNQLFTEYALRTQPEPKPQHIQIEISNFPQLYDGLEPEECVRQAGEALRYQRAKKALLKEKKFAPVTEEEARAFYDAHLDLFRTADCLAVLRIAFFLETEELEGRPLPAATIDLLRLRDALMEESPVDKDVFLYAAGRISETFYQDRGYFGGVYRGSVEQPLEDILFALKPGTVSEPVKRDHDATLNLFLVLPSKDEFFPFEIVKGEIIQTLNFQRRKKILIDFCDGLMEKAEILRDVEEPLPTP